MSYRKGFKYEDSCKPCAETVYFEMLGIPLQFAALVYANLSSKPHNNKME